MAACLATVLCLVAPARGRDLRAVSVSPRGEPTGLRGLSVSPGGEPTAWAAAGVWSATAVLAKLAPVAALPMWSRRSGRPWKMLAVAGGLLAAAFLPVLAATGGVPPGLVTYAVTWEFDGPLFEPLWRLLDRAGAAPLLGRLLDLAKRMTGEFTRFNPLYHYLYPQFLAKVVLGAVLLAAIGASLLGWRARQPRNAAAATGWLFGAMLLLSATVYPWYVVWVLPWAALCRHTAWRALSGLVLLSYLAQRGGVPLMPWLFLAIWVPFWLLMATGRGWSSG